MTPNPDQIFAEIWNDLDKSMDALENGGEIDMSSLDDKVRAFCQTITTLPPLQALAYKDKLPQIIEYLTNLVNIMTEKREAIRCEIDETSQRKRAHLAYGSSSMYVKNNED
jgi:hypothetical protein